MNDGSRNNTMVFLFSVVGSECIILDPSDVDFGLSRTLSNFWLGWKDSCPILLV
jgi:hypothetical protein